jgi:regulatory protein
VEYVIEKLREYRFVDDKDYAETYAQNAASRKGKRLIKVELARKGIQKEDVESALETLEVEDQEEAAKNILQKYMRSKEPTRENLSKGFRYLMSKGFDYDVAKQALSALGDLDDM